jgi:hypothetical protein
LARRFDSEGAASAHDDDAASTYDATVLVGEDRDENFIAEALLGGVPIDVEEAGVAAVGAVFEDVPPVAILFAETHVVGDDVEDLAEAVLAEGFVEALVSFGAAEFFVYFAMIYDVVAMFASGRSLEIGRAIYMADTEFTEVCGDSRRVVEGEVFVELEAIRGAWDAWHRYFLFVV